MKKTLKIIVILVIIVAVGFGTYWFFDRQQVGPSSNFNIANYFPFGESPESTPGTNENGGGSETGSENNPQTGGNENTTPIPVAQFWQISENPQSGAVIFKNTQGTFVRYVDKATGNVFESNLSSSQRKRISNTTIPKVHETVWAADGNSLVLRYVDDNNNVIKTLHAKIIPSKATTTPENTENLQELQGTFLPPNIGQFVVEPGTTGKEKGFYLIPDTARGVVGFVANLDGSSPGRIFESGLREWLVAWPTKGTLTLTTKASTAVPGYLYFLNTTSGIFRKVIGNIKGLTTLTNPDASKILYSESTNSGFSLEIYDVATGKKQMLSQKTLPEKCVWSTKNDGVVFCAVPKSIPSNKYPDSWYQGIVSFDDAIWMVNASTSQSELLVDPKEKQGVEIDATNLILDADENYLLFTNKKDSQLWGLRLLEN